MLVNAASHPGPALWQGIMLCALPFWLWAYYTENGKYKRIATYTYVVFGALMLLVCVKV